MKVIALLRALCATACCALLAGPIPAAAAEPAWHAIDRSWFSNLPGCVPRVIDDFIDSASWNTRRLLPRDCRSLDDGAPLFSWTEPADRDTTQPYTLTVINAAGDAVVTRQTPVPRLMLDTALAPGSYTWTVRYLARAWRGPQTSAARRFAIAANARDTVLPTPAALVQQIAAKAHPRLTPAGTTLVGVGTQARSGEYAAAYTLLIKTADEALPAPITVSPSGVKRAQISSDAAYMAALTQLRNDSGREGMLIETLGYAWQFTANNAYRDNALARLRSLATWPADGATSEAAQDQANRNIYVALATGADLLWSQLTSADKTAIVAALRARIGPVVAQFKTLDAWPYNSHLQTAVGHTTTALALTVDMPGFTEGRAWLEQALELSLTQRFIWGEEDGGMGNGTTYAWYDFLNLVRSMAELRVIAGVDLASRGFGRRLGEFLLAATPGPQRLPSPFGDETETDYLYQAYSGDAYRLYALMSRQPQHAWYWRQSASNLTPSTFTKYLSALHFVTEAAVGRPVAPVAPTQVNFVFEDAGFVAFHNHPTSAQRSSLYFKSSRFGAYNHSHADQNAFVLHTGGTALLISGGFYPYYGSPHHLQMARATRYQNALTFDGGIGQAEATPRPTAPTAPSSSMDARGALVAVGGNSNLAIATGDATLAYRGYDAATQTWQPLLTDAVRSVAYLRGEKVVLVYDWATSVSPRRWELNLHSPATAFEPLPGGGWHVAQGKASACISVHGPATTFTQKTGFEVPPELARPAQVHGRFTVNAATTWLAALMVIREDCSSGPIAVSFAGSEATVRIGDATLRFNQRSAAWLQ